MAPETTLSSGITGASTSITVGSVTGFPSNTPYTLALDYEGLTEELVQVNSAAGTTLTVARAVDGTSAASHNAGARVRHVSSARDFADSRSHENSDQGIHGLAPGDTLVGEDAVQTLTNKTLNSPIINSATFTGTGSFVNIDFTGAVTGAAVATAKFRLGNQTDVSPVSTDHAFQIGPDSGTNLRMDGNEIMGVNNGAVSGLGLQSDGGALNAFINRAADSTTDTLTVNGQTKSTLFTSTRPTGTSTTYSSFTTGDTNARTLTRADGQIRWSDGTLATDTSISRTGVGTLTVGNNLTATNLTATGTTQTINLNVTGSATLPQTTASGSAVFTIASGWSLDGAQACKIGGMTTIAIQVTRTGTVLVGAAGTGNISPDSMIGTVTAAWRPGGTIATGTGAFYTAFGNGVTMGQCRYNPDNTIDLVCWMPGENIDAGTGINRFIMTFPSN